MKIMRNFGALFKAPPFMPLNKSKTIATAINNILGVPLTTESIQNIRPIMQDKKNGTELYAIDYSAMTIFVRWSEHAGSVLEVNSINW